MKKILSLLTASILFLGIGFTQVANAEWQKSSNGWNYYDNGSLKTGWVQDNGNWYFLNKSGNMVTGWIEDKGTWYYTREDGSLNNSKTTAAMPNEVQNACDMVKPFAGNLNIRYVGKGYVKDNDGFSNYGLSDKWVMLFSTEDNNGGKSDSYLVYDPYNCKIYELKADYSIEYLGLGKSNNLLTEDQAIQSLKTYLSENSKRIPSDVKIEESRNNYYEVHCYDDMGDHTATTGWYYIDKSTGMIFNMFNI